MFKDLQRRLKAFWQLNADISRYDTQNELFEDDSTEPRKPQAVKSTRNWKNMQEKRFEGKPVVRAPKGGAYDMVTGKWRSGGKLISKSRTSPGQKGLGLEFPEFPKQKPVSDPDLQNKQDYLQTNKVRQTTPSGQGMLNLGDGEKVLAEATKEQLRQKKQKQDEFDLDFTEDAGLIEKKPQGRHRDTISVPKGKLIGDVEQESKERVENDSALQKLKQDRMDLVSANQPTEQTLEGVPVLRIGDSKFVAAKGKGNSFDIINLESKEHVANVDGNEAREWLIKAELEQQDSKAQDDPNSPWKTDTKTPEPPPFVAPEGLAVDPASIKGFFDNYNNLGVYYQKDKNRRIGAAKAALKRERGKSPLFADQIEQEQPTAEQRVEGFEEREQKNREQHEQKLTEEATLAINKVAQIPQQQQQDFVDYYNSSSFPKTPRNLNRMASDWLAGRAKTSPASRDWSSVADSEKRAEITKLERTRNWHQSRLDKLTDEDKQNPRFADSIRVAQETIAEANQKLDAIEKEMRGESQSTDQESPSVEQPVATPTVKRAKDFRETGEYDVVLSNGSNTKIFRDVAQFGYPVWYEVGDENATNPMGIGSTRKEALETLESRLRNKTDDLLEQAKRYTEFGQNYDRNIDTAYQYLKRAKEGGYNDIQLAVLQDQLAIKLDAKQSAKKSTDEPVVDSLNDQDSGKKKSERATSKQLVKEVQSLGGTLDWESDDDVIYAIAPEGKVWADSGSVTMGQRYRDSTPEKISQSWKPEAFRALMDRVKNGVEDNPDLNAPEYQEVEEDEEDGLDENEWGKQEWEPISWTKYDDTIVKGRSASHYVHPDDSGKTLCGRRIPEQGDGLEYTESGHDTCKRCEKARERYSACSGQVDRQTFAADKPHDPKLMAWAKKEFEHDEHASNFHDWFHGSHVSDFQTGHPKKVLHGSPDMRHILNEGKFSSLLRGENFFFTDDHATANSYTDPHRAWDYQAAEPGIFEAYLSLKNPKVINAAGKRWRDTEHHVQSARDEGHDGLIIKQSRDHYNNNTEKTRPANVYVAFNNSQIKSAMKSPAKSRVDGKEIGGGANKGSFSNPDNVFESPNLYANIEAAIRRYAIDDGSQDVHPSPLKMDDPARQTNQKNWFKKSAAANPDGSPKTMFHGSSRVDRVGNEFKPERATSGPMAFFTDDQSVAGGYTNKKDTSATAMSPDDPAAWTINGVSNHGDGWNFNPKAWRSLPSAQRQKLTKLGRLSGRNPDTGEMEFTEEHALSPSHFDWTLKNEHRGNALNALWDHHAQSNADWEGFKEILEKLEIDHQHDNPWHEQGGMVPVHLSIQNPLVTTKMPLEVYKRLIRASSDAPPANRMAGGSDNWDKNDQEPTQWINTLKRDLKNGTQHAWTSIPDWVTDELKGMGYDGIQDKGGKYSPQEHNVWIPFRANQVKSAIGNSGHYDENDDRITYSAKDKSLEDRLTYAILQDSIARTFDS